MGVDKGATSRALASLVRHGLVDVTVDPADNRRRVMVFSEAGEKLRDQIMIVSLERDRRINAIFSPEDLATIRRLLNKLLASAREIDGFKPSTAKVVRQPAPRSRRRGTAVASEESRPPR
jgi:DNA-binding MarR family transcriptional regulator